MDTRIRPNRFYLSYIASIDTLKQLKKVVKASSDEEIRTILELIGNLCKGNFACRIADLTNLEEYRPDLNTLFDTRKSIGAKRDDLVKAKYIKILELVLHTSKHFIHELPYV